MYKQRINSAHAISHSPTDPQFGSMLGCGSEGQHSSGKGFQPCNSTCFRVRRTGNMPVTNSG